MTPDQFKELRDKAGYSQSTLVPVLGRSRRSISAYETGSAPIPPLVADAMRRLEKRENDK
jgi:predicted transcriptional regulator